MPGTFQVICLPLAQTNEESWIENGCCLNPLGPHSQLDYSRCTDLGCDFAEFDLVDSAALDLS